MGLKQSQRTAMAFAGTVALPSPFPACGTLSVVLVPDGGEYDVLVKITQVVGTKQIVTRFVRPPDIRAILTRPEGVPRGGPEGWPYRMSTDIQGEIDVRESALRQRLKDSADPPELEVDWHPAAIVYVPESAPVLHRVEVGVTAAVSAEDVGFSPSAAGCCGGGL